MREFLLLPFITLKTRSDLAKHILSQWNKTQNQATSSIWFYIKNKIFFSFLSESSNDYSLREAIVHSHFHTLAFLSYRFAVSFFAIFIDPFK